MTLRNSGAVLAAAGYRGSRARAERRRDRAQQPAPRRRLVNDQHLRPARVLVEQRDDDRPGSRQRGPPQASPPFEGAGLSAANDG